MTPVAIQTPFAESDAIELGRSTFRKQVLKVGAINYRGQKLDFTPAYCAGLAKAFTEDAFDSVPLVFASHDNAHSQAVDQIRGDIIGLEATADGLDAIVSIPDQKSAQLVRDHPKLGVSVRIEQPLDRADGRKWPAAVQHVLATANPRITGMRPWAPVDLAGDDLPVIDLSTYDFNAAEPTDTEEAAVPADTKKTFTEAEMMDRFRAFMAAEGAKPPTEPVDATPVDAYAEPTDEELDLIAAGLIAEQDTEPDVVAASSDGGALELANTRIDSQALELAAMREERDLQNYDRLVVDLAQTSGIPPYITELAKPLLLGTHVVELSSGAQVDAGEVIRKVLAAVGEHGKMVDLSAGDPVFLSATGRDDEQADMEKTKAAVAAYRKQHGMA